MPRLSSSIQVLVVGAGPTGLFLASELRRYGVHVRIIDRRQAPTTQSRATDLQPRSLEILEQAGALSGIRPGGRPLHAINIYSDARPIARMDFRGLDTHYNHMFASSQCNTELGLREHLKALGGRVERGVELVAIEQHERASTCTLQSHDGHIEVLRCEYVVGCDGARSTTRKLLGIPFPGATYDEHYLLADARVTWDLNRDELHGFIVRSGSLLVLALPGHDEYRLFADIAPSDRREPCREAFQEILDERAPMPATVHEVGWASRFRQHHRLVPRYRVGRCFLAGDSAHIHSIIPGQGLNLGIQDAYNLGWKLGLVCRGQARAALLASYEAERRPLALLTLRTTDIFHKTFTVRNRLGQRLRDVLLPPVGGAPWVHGRLVDLCAELSHNYRRSPVVSRLRARIFKGLQAGERAPDVCLTTDDGSTTRLFAHFGVFAHTLLVFLGGGLGSLNIDRKKVEQLAASLPQIGGHVVAPVELRVVVAGPEGLPAGLDRWVQIDDRRGAIHRRYGAKRGGLCLIRPDGYIGFLGPLEAPPLLDYLAGRACLVSAE